MALSTTNTEEEKEKLRLISYKEMGRANMGAAITWLIRDYEKRNNKIEIK